MIDKIKILLDIEDTELYDKRLNILIPSAIDKLRLEGVKEIAAGEENYSLYLNCIAYQVAGDIDIDVDMEKLLRRYLTNVVTLRG